MKKRNTTVIFAVLLILASLLFVGCNNVVSPSLSKADGKGNVTVSFSAGRAALLPSVLDFDVYQFIFTNTGDGPTISETRGKDEPFTFALEMGAEYILEVKAYKGSVGEGNLGAAGTSGAFTVKAVTNVQVALSGYLTEGIKGTFSYNIKLPENAEVEKFELYLDDSNSITLPAFASGGAISDSVDVAAGRYLLILWLSKGEAEAEDYRGVTIYSNAVTFYGTEADPIVFKNSDFRDPDVEMSDPVRVYFWRGFDVAGSGVYYDISHYKSGGAIGTYYETFVDDFGTHSDVLKLEPPSVSGYPRQTMVLTRPVIGAGTYTLSMDYFVEKGAQQAYVFWYNTGGGKGDNQDMPLRSWRVVVPNHGYAGENLIGETGYGTWLHMEDTFALNANDEIGIIAWNDSGSYGLKDAVIYIKNLELTDGSGEPVPEVDFGFEENVYDGVYPKNVALIPDGSLTIESEYEINWASADYNSSVITVDSNGKVTGIATGTTLLTASLSGDPSTKVEIPVKVITKPSGSKYIAFTFDDGPDVNWTPRFVNVLNGLGAQATFFSIGEKVNALPHVSKAVSDAGHEVGNHTYFHTMALQHESVATIRAELQQTQDAILSVTGKINKVFRGPALLYSKYGDRSGEIQYGEDMEEAARQLGLALIDGSGHQAANFDFDASYSAADIARINLVRQAKEWGILLMHDGWPTNVESTYNALPILIEGLYAQGYQILSVSEIAAKRKAAVGPDPAYDLEPGRIHYDFINMPQHVSGITVKANGDAVSDETIELESGQTVSLTAEITPIGSAVHGLFWYSDNSGIASVNSGGTVTANSAGTTTIRVAAGGMRAVITVIVDGEGPGTDPDPDPDPLETITEWIDENGFNIKGAAGMSNSGPYYTSNADWDVGSYKGYDNVLRLSPDPETGMYYWKPGSGGGVALNFEAPFTGQYALSMEVWVDTDRNDAGIIWYNCRDWDEFTGNAAVTVKRDWFTSSGTIDLGKGDILGLLAHSWWGETDGWQGGGLKHSTVYIRDLKLVYLGSNENIDVMDIPSTPVTPPETVTPGITLEWAIGGGLQLVPSVSSCTITLGDSITITAPDDFDAYDWYVGTKIDVTQIGNVFTFNSTGRNPGTYKVSLIGYSDAGTPACDTIEITVIR